MLFLIDLSLLFVSGAGKYGALLENIRLRLLAPIEHAEIPLFNRDGQYRAVCRLVVHQP